jgi:hypothetical protein
MRSKLILLSMLTTVLIAGVAIAQVSSNFDLRWWVHGGGGGARQSANFALRDTAGQVAGGVSDSSNFQIKSGFLPGRATTSTPAPPTDTPTPTRTPTFTPPPGATSTPTATPTPAPQPGGDSYEDDDVCSRASSIPTTGNSQIHTFHDEGDADWVKFTAQANKTYIIQVENISPDADAVLFLHDTCAAPPGGFGENAFGSTVRLEWDSTKNGDYYIQIQQFDPSYYGDTVNYEVSVSVDNVPPSAPTNPRCVTVDATTLGVQWNRSPERDVRRYRVNYHNQANTFSGSDDVLGGDTTYYELTGLTPGETYLMRVQALDFSNNESPQSGQVSCTATTPADTTKPTVTLQQPTSADVYTTTAKLMTFAGQAQDAGNNLSRVLVRNVTKGVDGWDYTLSGGSDDYRVQDLALGVGDNIIEITAYDDAGNSSKKTVTVKRLGQSPGAVIIVAGHNDTYGLATNIYNSANRAYRIFQSAGFSDDDIYYIAPVGQDADNNGVNDTDATATVANVQQAITVWAKERVGPNKPLFMYWMDHGFSEKFCVDGCGAGGVVSPTTLDGWLRTLETDSGVSEVNVVIEACRSGSFIHRSQVVDSISKAGRVIITSTGWNNNAYASAQGAYFSDAFFSCIADSGSLKACFDQANTAVQVAGTNQTPMLDDNGDGVFNSSDGAVAQSRFVTKFFASASPSIQSVDVTASGADGTLTAVVQEGAEPVEIVWAAVYPPDFVEPTDVTLNLNVPVVRLEPVSGEPGKYQVNYPNGFTKGPPSSYRIVFYAQDRLGINALPKRYGETGRVLYLPIVEK